MPRLDPSLLSNETRRTRAFTSYLVAVALVAVIGSASFVALPYLGYQAAGFVFLVGVLPIAVWYGLGPSLAFAALSALSWDYFFIPPQFHFTIRTSEDIFMNVTYFIVATVTGILGNRLQLQKELLRRRERHVQSLYELERLLSSAASIEEVVASGVKFMECQVSAPPIILVGDGLTLDVNHSDLLPDEKEEAKWVYRNEIRAGKGTPTFSNSKYTYYPLPGVSGPAGVIATQFHDDSSTRDKAIRRFSVPIGAALERERHRTLAQRNRLLEESEKLHQALLNSVSHELRTPITSLLGNLERLPDWLEPMRRPIVEELRQAGTRLNQTVTNLLDMSRVSSGALQIKRELLDLGDFLHSCISSTSGLTKGHRVTLSGISETVIIRGDEKLLETAVSNLIGNAARHSPPGTEIKLGLAVKNMTAEIRVDDSGLGIPEGSEERIFEKFFSSGAAGGYGLGLAIVRAIAEPHGGTVSIEKKETPGARFVLSLPVETLPPHFHSQDAGG